MEASSTTPTPPPFQFQPDTEKIKQYLLKRGVYPIPKFVRNISKKQIQKYNRTLRKRPSQTQSSILTQSQKQALPDETHFRNLKREYRRFTRTISPEGGSTYLVGSPWVRIERLRSREIASETMEFNGEKLKKENLKELREMFEEDLRWVLDDDMEMLEGIDCYYSNETWDSVRLGRRQRSEAERIRFLVDRLSQLKVTARDWKLVRMMKQSELRFSEDQLLKILEGLGEKNKWQQALAVVERVYEKKREYRSRFVYTKLLAVLGKARRPHEALSIFNLMRGDCNIYPDMAAYHSIAVTLGQAGLLKELVDAIETMKQRPKRIRNMCLRNWDPVLEPDVVVFNAVLNACVSSHQWKGVSWVFQQLRKSGLKPDGATYGLAMEVMLQSGKYDLVHEYFRKMTKKGEAPKAVTYKVLVRAFWEEGKVNEAVEAVREMEERGVVGTAGVYYELACCLCYSGRWQVAIKEVEKIKKLPHSRPLVVAYTGMIHSSMDGGYVDHCISIFEHMKDHCAPNIGTINAMLKVYGRNDMFSEAKALFEEIKCASDGANTLIPDDCTYTQMLEASASAAQWEYFDYVYREMALSGYQLGQSKYARLLVEATRAGKAMINPLWLFCCSDLCQGLYGGVVANGDSGCLPKKL
ncbi:hypothetical protein HS088_TW03G00004 [Tripterygium wilfordii]|uniref:Pentatricopeptide repeat-containing protein n=1 Tax=Tripterygium wilfordii TaxID=458696 RepID=A0A7J7DTR3_TRIWF|nr:hypothetical protein HS088_TW03G00004 [Tripterygium wilfordii]